MTSQLLQTIANVIAVIISLPLLAAFARIVWLVAQITSESKETRKSLESFVDSCNRIIETHSSEIEKLKLDKAFRDGRDSHEVD